MILFYLKYLLACYVDAAGFCFRYRSFSFSLSRLGPVKTLKDFPDFRIEQPDIEEKIRLSLYIQNFRLIALSENSFIGTGQHDKCARQVYKEKSIF